MVQEAVARDFMGRNKKLEEDLWQQRSKAEALEQQLLGLGHAPCSALEAQAGGVSSTGAARRDEDGDSKGGGRLGGQGGMPRIPKIRGSEGARAEALSSAAAAAAAAAESPRESVIGKLARVSVPNLKRRADGSWGEGDDAGAKRQRGGEGSG